MTLNFFITSKYLSETFCKFASENNSSSMSDPNEIFKPATFIVEGQKIVEQNPILIAYSLKRYRAAYLFKTESSRENEIVLDKKIFKFGYFQLFLEIAKLHTKYESLIKEYIQKSLESSKQKDKIKESINQINISDHIILHYLYYYADYWGFGYLKNQISSIWDQADRSIYAQNLLDISQQLTNDTYTTSEYIERLANSHKFFLDNFSLKDMPFPLASLIIESAYEQKILHSKSLCHFLIYCFREEKHGDKFAPFVTFLDFDELSFDELKSLFECECTDLYDFITVKQFQRFSSHIFNKLHDTEVEQKQITSEYKSKIAALEEKIKKMEDTFTIEIQKLEDNINSKINNLNQKFTQIEESFTSFKQKNNVDFTYLNSKLEKFDGCMSQIDKLMSTYNFSLLINRALNQSFAKNNENLLDPNISLTCSTHFEDNVVENILNDNLTLYKNEINDKMPYIIIDFKKLVIIKRIEIDGNENGPFLSSWKLSVYLPDSLKKITKDESFREINHKNWTIIDVHERERGKPQIRVDFSYNPVCRYAMLQMSKNSLNGNLMIIKMLRIFGITVNIKMKTEEKKK